MGEGEGKGWMREEGRRGEERGKEGDRLPGHYI